MEIQKALASAYAILRQYGLNDWTVRASREKNVAGRCYHSRKQITLSKPWTEALTEEEVMETIIHEVAHARAGFKAGHGSEWNRIYMSMGGNGDVRVTNPSARVASKYVGKCPGGHITDMERHAISRHMTEQNFICKKCMNEGRTKREAALDWYERATMRDINEMEYA